MILIIDNYDSFSFNLVQMIGELKDQDEEIKVIRNDEMTVDEVLACKPSHIVLSPGPGRPVDAGICEELIKAVPENIPLMGVCLGHQAICESLGGRITYAEELMHGKQSRIKIDNTSPLFQKMPEEIDVARYHSLVADKAQIPEALVVTAEDEKGEVMAVRHKSANIYGVQFHPESIMTPQGKQILKNFLAIA